MRYHEIVGTKREKPTTKITLSLLNKLKHLRNSKRAHAQKKSKMLNLMYGNKNLLQSERTDDAMREIDFERQKLELEKKSNDIALEIEKAKISSDSKKKIRKLAAKHRRH